MKLILPILLAVAVGARAQNWPHQYKIDPGQSHFAAQVPEGSYRVTLTFGGGPKATSTTVKAEARRLMLEEVRTAPGHTDTRSFIVNVRTPALAAPPENAPGGTSVRLKGREIGSPTWDDKLSLEFLGPVSAVREVDIQRVDVPTVYLVGDSTVTDQQAEPAASWGQMLPRFFRADVAIANHAESGETLKSFITELRLAKALSRMKAGDWMIIQFGHNDEKKQWPQTYADPHSTYPAYLRAFIAEARLRGATPILVTPTERRNFDASGHIVPSHGDYPDAVRAVAREEKVGLIDLTRMTTTFYEALGPERSPLAFNDGGKDKTHHDNYGAYEIARMVASSLVSADPRLAAHLLPEGRGYDPAKPDPPERFALPASAEHSEVRPDGS
jgi:lysophospholipase L1-like esterase